MQFKKIFYKLWIFFEFPDIFWTSVHYPEQVDKFWDGLTFFSNYVWTFETQKYFVFNENYLNSWIFVWLYEHPYKFLSIVFQYFWTCLEKSWTCIQNVNIFWIHKFYFWNHKYFSILWLFLKKFMNIFRIHVTFVKIHKQFLIHKYFFKIENTLKTTKYSVILEHCLKKFTFVRNLEIYKNFELFWTRKNIKCLLNDKLSCLCGKKNLCALSARPQHMTSCKINMFAQCQIKCLFPLNIVRDILMK